MQLGGVVSSAYDYISLGSTTSANTNAGAQGRGNLPTFASSLSSNGTLSGVIELFGISASSDTRRSIMRLATTGRQSITTFGFAAGSTLSSLEFYASMMDSGSVRVMGEEMTRYRLLTAYVAPHAGGRSRG